MPTMIPAFSLSNFVIMGAQLVYKVVSFIFLYVEQQKYKLCSRFVCTAFTSSPTPTTSAQSASIS